MQGRSCGYKKPMNETELLDSLHDAQILAIKQDGRRVIIEINYTSTTSSRLATVAWPSEPRV